MKIIVDKLPETKESCLFSEWKYDSIVWKEHCKLSGEECTLYSEGCDFLIEQPKDCRLGDAES